MKKTKVVKKFKSEYIPVFISFLILILLVCGLCFTIMYEPKTKNKINSSELDTNDLNVDFNNISCDTNTIEQLVSKADKIKLTPEVKEVVIGTGVETDTFEMNEGDLYGFIDQITIENLTDDFYIVVSNDYNDETETYYKNDFDNGVIQFDIDLNGKLMEYYVDIKTNNEECTSDTIKKLSFSLPIYNTNSEYYYCSIYPDFKYCQEFIYEDTITFTEFEYELERYIKEQGGSMLDNINNNTFLQNITVYATTTTTNNGVITDNSVTNFVLKYKLYFIIGVASIFIIIFILIIIIKKRKAGK